MDLNQGSHSISMSNASIPSYYGNYMEFCQIRSNPIEQGQDPMVLLWEHFPSRFYDMGMVWGTPIPFPYKILWLKYGFLPNT